MSGSQELAGSDNPDFVFMWRGDGEWKSSEKLGKGEVVVGEFISVSDIPYLGE